VRLHHVEREVLAHVVQRSLDDLILDPLGREEPHPFDRHDFGAEGRHPVPNQQIVAVTLE
jgi:hypothetical protein